MKNVTVRTALLNWLLACCLACQPDEVMQYQSPDNVYFDFTTAPNRDSLLYSFAYTPELPADTIFLPVRISGLRVPVS